MTGRKIKKLTITQAAYIAGMIDGEGCISVSRTTTSKSAKGCKRGQAYRASVAIVLTDKEVLVWLQNITGIGKLCEKKVNKTKHRPAWSWAVWSIEAVQLLEVVMPYLFIKRRQAVNLIEFQGAMRQPGVKGLSDAEWNKREEYWNRSKFLNKRGI